LLHQGEDYFHWFKTFKLSHMNRWKSQIERNVMSEIKTWRDKEKRRATADGFNSLFLRAGPRVWRNFCADFDE
jgi:hypothetical protein